MIEITGIRLERGCLGTVKVFVEVNGKWIQVISDSGEWIMHNVTELGLRRCVEASETVFARVLNHDLKAR